MLNTVEQSDDYPRVQHLRDRIGHAFEMRELCLERPRFFTQVYQEAKNESIVLRQAKGLERTLRQMTILLDEDDRLVGNPSSKRRSELFVPEYGWNRLGYFQSRFGKKPPAYFTEEEKTEFKELKDYWKGRTLVDEFSRRWEQEGQIKNGVEYASLPQDPENSAEMNIGIPFATISAEQGHVLLGCERVIREGFGNHRARAFKEIEKREHQLKDTSGIKRESLEKEIDFLNAVVICCDATIAFSHRFAALARQKATETSDPHAKQEFNTIAEICENVPEHPACNFREALQSIWFVQCIASITGQHGHSPGRIDQYLWPFYQRDIANGDLTRDEALDLIEELFIKMRHPTEDITIGGIDIHEQDATNEISYLILEIFEQRHPIVHGLGVRIHPKTPREFMIRACKVFRTTSGISFLNDAEIIPSLIDRGTAREDAWDYGMEGCVEIAVCGKSSPCAVTGYLNLAGMVELALNDGRPRDAAYNVGQGVPTGNPRNFKSFQEVMDAVKTQLTETWKRMVPFTDLKDACFTDVLPAPFVSTTIDGCIDSGRDFTDSGPIYNNAGIWVVGNATAFDSLMAIKKVIFDEKIMTMDEMLNLLETNFEGAEDKRLMLVNRAPKFGNDDDYDEVASELFSFVCDTINDTPRLIDGAYTTSAITSNWMVSQGLRLGATPDGREAGASISNSLSPSNGAERKGLATALHSMSKLDQGRMSNGVAYNPRIHPSFVEGETVEKFADLLAAYFDMGGFHVMPNVVSTETLKDAQKHPEEYRDLIVRVSGFSALFTYLSESVQNDIIARTEMRP